jgi:hypothetical protein
VLLIAFALLPECPAKETFDGEEPDKAFGAPDLRLGCLTISSFSTAPAYDSALPQSTGEFHPLLLFGMLKTGGEAKKGGWCSVLPDGSAGHKSANLEMESG